MKVGDVVKLKSSVTLMTVRWVKVNSEGDPTFVTCTWIKEDGNVSEFEFKYNQLEVFDLNRRYDVFKQGVRNLCKN